MKFRLIIGFGSLTDCCMSLVSPVWLLQVNGIFYQTLPASYKLLFQTLAASVCTTPAFCWKF